MGLIKRERMSEANKVTVAYNLLVSRVSVNMKIQQKNDGGRGIGGGNGAPRFIRHS